MVSLNVAYSGTASTLSCRSSLTRVFQRLEQPLRRNRAAQAAEIHFSNMCNSTEEQRAHRRLGKRASTPGSSLNNYQLGVPNFLHSLHLSWRELRCRLLHELRCCLGHLGEHLCHVGTHVHCTQRIRLPPGCLKRI